MRLTTERKLCGGVLLLAVVALGVDRLVLGGAGGPASAAAAELLPPIDPAPAEPTKPRASAPGMGVPVAKQLAVLPAGDLRLDGFAAPARWREAIDRAEAAAAAASPSSGPSVEPIADPAIARFMKHQLSAVLSEKGEAAKALVKLAPNQSHRTGSRLLKIGDELDGFKLIHLDNKQGTSKAIFEDPTGKSVVELEIPVAGGQEKSE